jgi:hypothetical protein
VGVGLRENLQVLILSVRDAAVLHRYESHPPESATKIGLPVFVEIEHFTELGGPEHRDTAPIRSHMRDGANPPRAGLWGFGIG